MTTVVDYSGTPAAASRPSRFEYLVSDNFERIYAMIDAFVGDYRLAVLHAQSVFRDLEDGDACERCDLYVAVAQAIRLLPACPALPQGMTVDDALCLLFKEIAGLRYREISDVLGLSLDDVKTGIARARQVLVAA